MMRPANATPRPRFSVAFIATAMRLVLAGFGRTFVVPMMRGTFSVPWFVYVHAALFFAWTGLLTNLARVPGRVRRAEPRAHPSQHGAGQHLAAEDLHTGTDRQYGGLAGAGRARHWLGRRWGSLGGGRNGFAGRRLDDSASTVEQRCERRTRTHRVAMLSSSPGRRLRSRRSYSYRLTGARRGVVRGVVPGSGIDP